MQTPTVKAVLIFIMLLILLFCGVRFFFPPPTTYTQEDCTVLSKTPEQKSHCWSFPKEKTVNHETCAKKRFTDTEVLEVYKQAIKEGVETTPTEIKTYLNSQPLCDKVN